VIPSDDDATDGRRDGARWNELPVSGIDPCISALVRVYQGKAGVRCSGVRGVKTQKVGCCEAKQLAGLGWDIS
jgi:hypothetical protein